MSAPGENVAWQMPFLQQCLYLRHGFLLVFLPEQWRARGGLLPLLARKDLSEGLESRFSPRCGTRGSAILGSQPLAAPWGPVSLSAEGGGFCGGRYVLRWELPVELGGRGPGPCVMCWFSSTGGSPRWASKCWCQGDSVSPRWGTWKPSWLFLLRSCGSARKNPG